MPLDAHSFEELHRRYRKSVWLVCRKILLRDEEAEDATQLTMVKAWVKREQFDPSRPFWPWVKAIALKTCLDVLRSANRLKEDPGVELLSDCGDTEALLGKTQVHEPSYSPFDVAEMSEMKQAFAKCWVKLRESHRFALLCVDWSDWRHSWRYLSQTTSKDLAAIRMTVIRAGRALLRCMREAGYEPDPSDFLALLEDNKTPDNQGSAR